MIKTIIYVAVLLAIADLALAAAGYGIRVERDVVQPGQTYYAGTYGNLGLQKTPTLVCKYWKGLDHSFTVAEYGDGDAQKSDCPYFIKVY